MNDYTGSNTGAKSASPPIPSIEVRVYPQAQRNENDKLLGFASVTIGGVFAVNSLRLMDSAKGPFVAMPSRKDKDGNYHDICLPITLGMHKALNKAVIEGYKEAVAELNSRGAEVAQKASMRDQLKSAQQEATARPALAAARTAKKGAR